MLRNRYAFRLLMTFVLFLILLLLVYVIKYYSIIKIKPVSNYNETDIVINFLLPMRQDFISSKVAVVPEIPGTVVYHQVNWLDSTTMVLKLEQRGGPQGQLLTFKINRAATIIPFIYKSVDRKVRPQVPVRLLSKAYSEKIPSRGPVTLNFNTPVEPKSLTKSVILPVPGYLKPLVLSIDGKSYTDYSRWEYTPRRPFKNDASYRVIIKPGLRSMGGAVLDKRQEITFITATKPKVISTQPANGDSRVPLYRAIEFVFEQEISTASVKVTGLRGGIDIPGNTQIEHKNVIFQPSSAFLPDHKYKVVLQAKSKEHESLEKYEFCFTTVDMDENYWVDVKLGEKHTVTVYKGSTIIRHMLASGGRPESPTPLGHFYTQDRGHSFWSARFGEGASYWVRLVNQILVHSVPKDSRWQTKEEEHAKLGLPASHGCIRLDEEDAKWFFENIPKGTLVIIHQ